MSKALVSVVVPVYNAVKYLEECLDSIVGQSYKDLEIILVDDGSVDGSSEICDDYAKKDSRIRVFHQENQGAATARKNGIECASGKFLCFVDSDDVIKERMIEALVEQIQGCDLVCSGCICYTPEGKEYHRYDAFPEGVYSKKDELKYLLSNMITYQNRFEDGFLPFLVNKMYRTSIVKEVLPALDLSLFYAEDRDLLFRYILRCKSVCITHGLYYQYRYRADSAVHSVNPRFLENLNRLYLSLEKEFICHPQREVLMYQLQRFIVSRLYDVPIWLGFCPDAQMIRYVLSAELKIENKRVILYGAGRVGKDYYSQICAMKNTELVAWVDKEWDKYQSSGVAVQPVQSVENQEYNCVVIAVKKKEVAQEIKQELIASGIAEDKIVWSAPSMLVIK